MNLGDIPKVTLSAIFLLPLLLSITPGHTAEPEKITLAACRPRGTTREFTGRLIEVSSVTPGNKCGVFRHLLPDWIYVDEQNQVSVASHGQRAIFGRAVTLGKYQVLPNHKGPVHNECNLFELFPDPKTLVETAEETGFPYPTLHTEGGMFFPLPVLKRRLTASLSLRIDDINWSSVSCVQDQVRYQNGDWTTATTSGETDTPVCWLYRQPLPVEYARMTERSDSKGQVTNCDYGLLSSP